MRYELQQRRLAGESSGVVLRTTGLKPEDIELIRDGEACDFAHVRWSAYQTKDPYSDVIVHEVAHLLHCRLCYQSDPDR
jgi:hypothetical protein